MARRAKPAAEPVVSLAPPPSPHPPGGYDARTVAEAAEIIRHQSHVLEVRARIATAAGGVRPLHSDPPASAPAGRLGLEGREAELTAREANLAEREARVLGEKQLVADAAVELDRDRRMLATREEEVAARDAALRAETAAARMRLEGIDAARAGLEATAQALAERESALAEAESAVSGAQKDAVIALASAHARLDQATAAERENNELRAQLRAELEAVASRAGELETRERSNAAASDALKKRQMQIAAETDALAHRAVDLEKREREVADTARQVERSRQTLAERTSRLERLEKDLARRHAETAARARAMQDLEKREARLEKERARLAERERAVEARASGLRRQAKEQKQLVPARDEQEQPEAVPAPVAPSPVVIKSFNVDTLASLVEQRGREFPDRIDEWHWTVVSLRDVADVDGELPRTVDALVHDVFEPILS